MRYVVRPGDDFFTIAGRHGFSDSKPIEDAPENRQLKEGNRGRSPNVLEPGHDEVFIPEIKPSPMTLKEKSTTSFKLVGPTRSIKLKLTGEGGKPDAGRAFRLYFGEDDPEKGKVRSFLEGKSDGDGMITAEVSWRETLADLETDDGTHTSLMIGHLNPAHGTEDHGLSGIAQRLALLNYHPGPLDGSDPAAMKGAIWAFQQSLKLEPDGLVTPDLVERLIEKSGI